LNGGEMKLADYTVSFEDLRIPGLGLPIGIRRQYDTKQPQSGDFGKGWTLDFTGVYIRTDAPCAFRLLSVYKKRPQPGSRRVSRECAGSA
jgi:hypothetical protein